MKLSTRARYGLKALIDLGLHSANEAISLQSIAERQDISTSYLEQLMAMLKKAGLVKSNAPRPAVGRLTPATRCPTRRRACRR